MRRTLIFLALCAMILAGCGKEEDGMELQERAEARAAQSRTNVDELATLVGTSPTVAQDEMADCVPGDEDSGLEHLYTVHVTADDTTPERLNGEIADRYEAEGWTVKRDSVDPQNQVVSVRFAKDGFNLGVKFSAETGRATVGGSGGCVT